MTIPFVNPEMCIGCHACESECPVEAIVVGDENIAVINDDSCIGCYSCVAACPSEAISEPE